MEWDSRWTVPAVGVGAFGLGVAVGYAISQHRSKLARQVLGTIREALDEDEEVNDDQLSLDDVEAVGEEFEVESVTLDDGIHFDLPPEAYEEVERTSVFPSETPEWDYEVELADRAGKDTYIIHRDEFFNEESGYIQTTLTYYRGDDVLLDDHDVPIYNQKAIVGENLEFGKGSEDPSIVYIRNDRLEGEYEVLLDNGYYQVEVLGEEIEHSFEHKPPLHKFRD